MRSTSEHVWPVKRLRFLTQQGLSNKRQKILSGATQVTFLPMENIGEQGAINCSLIRNIDDVRNGYTRFFDGDVLVAKITPCFENGKGALVQGTLSGVGFGTTELHVLAPTDEIDARFLYYVTASHSFRERGEAAMFGAAGQKRVPEDFIRDYRVPVPPPAKQRAIADYLDRETARLDALVVMKERLFELMAERRQALIVAAVTGTIDSVVRLKPSHDAFLEDAKQIKTGANREGDRKSAVGDDGVRSTSEHVWPVKRLRFLTQQGLSNKRQKVLSDTTQVTFLPMENIGEQGAINCSLIRNIDDVRNGYTRFFDGDVLVAKITPCFENGKGALVQGTLSGVGFGTTELHVLAPTDEIDARFLYYVTASHSFRERGEAAMFGAAGQKRVPEDFIRDYRVPVPPPAKQRAIADYLDRETAKLDTLKAKINNTIALLKERRAALIAAAVTGQIAVEDTT